MTTIGTARAVADLATGLVIATVEVPASPERVFEALTSAEVCRWWVRPGVFDTREWTADVRPGGRWRATGVGGGRPYTLEGEFIEVDRPHRLLHTWTLSGAPEATTNVEYVLERVDGGTRVTLRQSRFAARGPCAATALGWETSFEELARMLGR
jgi:uncharacterized protein YndB with AHSA1/START domain